MTKTKKSLNNLGSFKHLTSEEHDSCGIVATIEKNGIPTRANMLDTIDALIKTEHRSGFIQGEGDGCGILTDIPRALWADKLADKGLADIVHDPRFAVAHIFLPKSEEALYIREQIIKHLSQNQFEFLHEELDQVNHSVLGPNAQADEPHFWQIAVRSQSEQDISKQMFEQVVQLETQFPVQLASFSNHSVVYKLMGAASLIPKYFNDLNDDQFKSLATIGHNRYSTNTLSNFFRVQPFSILGHNGEINTARKLRDEAQMIGAPLEEESSDSQDLNRVVETLIHRYDYSLFEAIEIVFPPIIHELHQLPEQIRQLYTYYRQTWGPFSQGPAGIISRYGNECAFSVDALGLRPLWLVETVRSYSFSSEQGIVPVSQMIGEPKPLAPGETIGVQLLPQAKVYAHHELQQVVLERTSKRCDFTPYGQVNPLPKPKQALQLKDNTASAQAYAAFGWEREQIQMVEQMGDIGVDPIRSLGHDAPLAALAKMRQNIPDYIKESVAVVTNPAIDREREMEHFSTRILLGERPRLGSAQQESLPLDLPSPILVEGKCGQRVSEQHKTYAYEEVLHYFSTDANRVHHFSLSYKRGTSIPDRLHQLANEAIEAVQAGKTILILDDQDCHTHDQMFLDPHIAISKVDQALKLASHPSEGQNLRRKASIIVRSAAMRSLHDLATAIGLGADAVSPYLMFATLHEKENAEATHLFTAINKGLEKIISTIGIHELRGYARLFSSIGLHPEIAEILQIVNYGGSSTAGLSWKKMEQSAEERYLDFNDGKAKAARLFHLWPRVWKSIGQLAANDITYEEFANKLETLETENPLSLRHVTDLKIDLDSHIDANQVDLSIGKHDLPLAISSMSFGSQNEIAFRAYAEAANRLNMVSLNGEGGEIKDMLGKYPNTRGHQIASGRFGVNVELANSANILEIKIGQGAKPGEGGHLPGKKVSPKVAEARNATPGSDLISPSNNHDIYSIEDLAQIITELKTANKQAQVIVKVPIVPNIGTIAVGIAKAGADIITLSGFDGGTGAARIHALQHVGLPAEIGVKAAHNALLEVGLRDHVEIWADGGVKSALDAVKLMLLGANRIGFGTLAMLAIGCTTCKGCHLDTCHVGIATQIETVEEAEEHGLRRFVPRQLDIAIENLMHLFSTFGQQIREITAQLGEKRTQDLVGRSDLLVQTRALEALDLSDLLQVTPPAKQLESREEVLIAGRIKSLSEDQHYTFTERTVDTFTQVDSTSRVLLSNISGARVRNRLDGSYHTLPESTFTFGEGSIPGNGFAAYHAEGMQATVHGGAQDGVGKTAFGGKVAILKSPNQHNVLINGSVGKGFCYGAQKGLFIAQGDADSRAGIRLSGADIIIGGELTAPVKDELGFIANRANIKGFAFEYMTDGRAVVLGDPGPWICSGMTGGVVYLRLQPELGLDEVAIMRRIAKAAKVSIEPLNEKGIDDLQELLTHYLNELREAKQYDTAEHITNLLANLDQHFIQVIPNKQQADPAVSTE
ncbi:glutamate synthase [Hazenella sp. IB182353]|uniref:glutamate synthase-related protein n=1 Tax=Polycladospora coralii TaxID=2771432 RepID=UPI001747D226|nr:glutamate synthase-related protein [Polycladospora coralii]MBS7531610.1 glutamate synthase [Polycladospora coralii]